VYGELVSVEGESLRVMFLNREERRGEELCEGAHHSSESSPMLVRATPPSASRSPAGRDRTGQNKETETGKRRRGEEK
jgi:hypothetical protein